jgi:cell wall-associated NlpC family hydrolase
MTDLVSAARARLGTRFRHRGRSSKYTDCAGLGVLIYADCGVALPDYRLYGREPNKDGLVDYVTAALGQPVAVAPVSLPDIRVGDVIVLRFDVEPHHVAIVANYIFGGFSMIHADGHTGKVIEHRMAPDHVKRITHVFRRPV